MRILLINPRYIIQRAVFFSLDFIKDDRFVFQIKSNSMSVERLDKDWIIDLNVRPNEMSPVDPPTNHNDENYSRILSSICSMTLGERFSSHDIDPYILEHIQLEKECSEQDDLTLIWSDDISLTLCFLASLAHHGQYHQEHLLQRYFQWWMNG
jgi:hypothetical protein